MSDNKSQPNNDYSKDINLLTSDLEQETKATVHIDDVQKSLKQDLLHDEKVSKDEKPEHESWLHKVLHHDEIEKPKPSSEDNEIKFKKGSKDRFNLDIKDTVKPTKQYTPDKPKQKSTVVKQAQVSSSPVPTLKPPVPPVKAKPKSNIPDKPKQIPTSVKQVSQESQKKSSTRSHLTLPSIKDFMASDKEEKNEVKGSFDVNLIPVELRSVESSGEAIKKFSIAGGASVLFVIIVFVGLSFVGSANQQNIIDLQEEVQVYEEEVQTSRETIEQLAAFTDQTQKVGELLQGREKWSGLFDMLEQDTIEDVYYQSVVVAPDDRVVLQVVARTYHDLARQYKIFDNNSNITNIEMSSASLDTALWESYIDLSKQEAKKIKEAGTTSTQDFIFDQNKLKSLLTVESLISFDYLINTTSTTLDRYE